MRAQLCHVVAHLLDGRRLSRLWPPVAPYPVPGVRSDLAAQGLVPWARAVPRRRARPCAWTSRHL